MSDDDGNDFAGLGEEQTERPRRPTFDAGAIDTRAETDRVIKELNRPGDHRKVFQYAGRAVVIVRDKSSILRTASGRKQVTRSVPRPANKGLLTGPIEQVSLWERWDGRANAMRPRPVPSWVFSTIIEIYGEGLLPLAGICDFPVIADRGKLLSGRTGYDESSGLFVECSPVTLDTNKFKSAREAFAWIMENWLSEFPFASEQDAARALAIPLTILNRRTRIHGGSPIPFITAPEVETGKTWLARTLVESVTGMLLPASAWDHDNEAERRKNMLAMAMENPAAVLFDNIQNGWEIRDATLDKYITSDEFKDRVLGKNETATAPATCLPIFTGNNIAPGSQDMASRSYEIRLQRGRGRRRFKRKDLMSWAQKNRVTIIQALYTIATEDRRRVLPFEPESRFPSWSTYVGGPVQYAADDKTIFKAWDTSDMVTWDENLEALCKNMASRKSMNDVGYTATQIMDMMKEEMAALFPHQMKETSDRISPQRLTGLLRKRNGHPAGKNRFQALHGDHPSRTDRKVWFFKAIPME